MVGECFRIHLNSQVAGFALNRGKLLDSLLLTCLQALTQNYHCGSDQACVRNKRVDVSNAFFYEQEYQQTASYVFRLYRAAYGNNQPFPNPDSTNQTEANKLPSYAAFVPDRARVVGGSDLAKSQLALANGFVQRPEFQAKYHDLN